VAAGAAQVCLAQCGEADAGLQRVVHEARTEKQAQRRHSSEHRDRLLRDREPVHHDPILR
jgi:hypothetical protein